MDATTLSRVIRKFTAGFCNEIDNKEGYVCSPLSAQILLGLTALATRGAARKELLDALHMPDIKCSIEGLTLDVATRMYVRHHDSGLHPKIKRDAMKVFNADIEMIDFDDGNTAAELIDDWVISNTHGKITKMIDAGYLDMWTRIVLVNALYFKGSWEQKFDPRNTRKRSFYVTKNKIRKVLMMHLLSLVYYGENEELNSKVLKLPYAGDDAEMVFILPNNSDGLRDMMTQLANGYDLPSYLNSMTKVEIAIGIPKFQIESTVNLKRMSPKFGIDTIYDSSVRPIKVMNETVNMYVSEAMQKAFLEIDEEGGEGDEAAGGSERMSFKSEHIGFLANRPFYYMLFVRQVVVLAGVFIPKKKTTGMKCTLQ